MTALPPFQRLCHFLSGHDALRTRPSAMGPWRQPTRLDAAETLALLGRPASFLRVVRVFAFYRLRDSCISRFSTPASNINTGTQFVIATTRAGAAVSVTVVDPRSDEPTTLDVAAFLKRTGVYWETHFPQGWATLDSEALPSPTPDFQRAVYTACLTAAEAQTPSRAPIAKAASRFLATDPKVARAKFTPKMLLRVCALARPGGGAPAWVPVPASAEWRMPLFECLELKHVASYMLANNTHGRLHTSKARIELDAADSTRWVVAPSFSDVVAAEIAQFSGDVVALVAGTTPEALRRADPATAHDLAARKRRRDELSAGAPPPCVATTLYPPSKVRGAYPKNGARWRAAAVTRETADRLGCAPETLVDFSKMYAHWASHPQGSLKKLEEDLKNPTSKPYTISCKVMNADARACPHGGDVKVCAAALHKTIPSTAFPSAVWLSPELSGTLKKYKM